MKKILLVICSVSLLSTTMAQLKPKTVCPEFTVDILDGKVNGLKANASNADIKLVFPCSTSSDEEGGTAKCGANVAFKDRDLTFYTQRDYIQIGPKFKGKMNVPLLGAKRGSLFKFLGNPSMKDTSWDAFQMNYGTLVLHYDATGKIILIQFSTLGTDQLNLCE